MAKVRNYENRFQVDKYCNASLLKNFMVYLIWKLNRERTENKIEVNIVRQIRQNLLNIWL